MEKQPRTSFVPHIEKESYDRAVERRLNGGTLRTSGGKEVSIQRALVIGRVRIPLPPLKTL